MAAIQRPALPIPLARGRLRTGRWLALAVALVVGGALLQVNQSSAVTGTGYDIEGLKRERAAKQAQNHDLEAEVARLSSLARVEIEARVRLQMDKPKNTLNMNVAGPVPDHQTLPTRFLPPPFEDRDAGADPPFWRRLLDLLPY
jgi:cell division protein FtsL